MTCILDRPSYPYFFFFAKRTGHEPTNTYCRAISPGGLGDRAMDDYDAPSMRFGLDNDFEEVRACS